MSKEVLTHQYGITHYVLKANTEGISHEDSLQQPSPAGNCLNWVVGHIVATRNHILKSVGEEPIWNEEQAAPYQGKGSGITDAAGALPFARILSDLDASQERLMEGLGRLDDEALAANIGSEEKPQTLASMLASLAFHESYHAGQTGLLRRLVGKGGALG